MQLDVKCVIGCDPEQLQIHTLPLKWEKWEFLLSPGCWIRALRTVGYCMPGQALLPMLLHQLSPCQSLQPPGLCSALCAWELWLSRTVLCWGPAPCSDHLLHVPAVPFSIAQHYCCLKHSHSIMDYWNALFGLSGSQWPWKTHCFTECLPECLKFDGSLPLWT